MTDPAPFQEMRYYNQSGFLYQFDIRYDATNPAYFNPLPDGRIQIRLQAEPVFQEAVLVCNDGRLYAVPMEKWESDGRFQHWHITFHPNEKQPLHYYFAFRKDETHVAYFGRHGITGAVESPFISLPEDRRPFVTPHWMHGAVIYQIFPERFCNGDPNNDPENTSPWGSSPTEKAVQFMGGDLNGITAKLDYLKELGIDLIYINPVNSSPSNHKFDAREFYHVDPAFGGDEALEELVDQAHQKGLKVIVDASFNHCHPTFPYFQDIKENGPDSPYWDWFTIKEYPLTVKYRPHLYASSGWLADPAEIQGWFQKFTSLTNIPVITVDDNDGPLIEPSYDAWYNVINMPRFNQDNPQTRAYFMDVTKHWLTKFKLDGWRMDVVQYVVPDFWQDFRRTAKETNPEAYLLAEVWGDTSFWLAGNRFDATMNYTFRDLCMGYFAEEAIDTETFKNGIVRMLGMYTPQVTAVNQNLVSSHDVARFLHHANEETTRLHAVLFFQMTMPGAPSIYYGDEIGMTGGDDPDNRRAFPWHDEASWHTETLTFTKTLTQLRHQQPALRYGDWCSVWVGDEALAFTRTYEEERLLVVLTRAQPLETATLPIQAKQVTILFGKGQATIQQGGVQVQSIPAWSGQVIKLS